MKGHMNLGQRLLRSSRPPLRHDTGVCRSTGPVFVHQPDRGSPQQRGGGVMPSIVSCTGGGDRQFMQKWVGISRLRGSVWDAHPTSQRCVWSAPSHSAQNWPVRVWPVCPPTTMRPTDCLRRQGTAFVGTVAPNFPTQHCAELPRVENVGDLICLAPTPTSWTGRSSLTHTNLNLNLNPRRWSFHFWDSSLPRTWV